MPFQSEINFKFLDLNKSRIEKLMKFSKSAVSRKPDIHSIFEVKSTLFISRMKFWSFVLKWSGWTDWWNLRKQRRQTYSNTLFNFLGDVNLTNFFDAWTSGLFDLNFGQTKDLMQYSQSETEKHQFGYFINFSNWLNFVHLGSEIWISWAISVKFYPIFEIRDLRETTVSVPYLLNPCWNDFVG